MHLKIIKIDYCRKKKRKKIREKIRAQLFFIRHAGQGLATHNLNKRVIYGVIVSNSTTTRIIPLAHLKTEAGAC